MTARPIQPESAPNCNHCRSFFVTHDSRRPYGCRTFGFHSARLPCDEVRLSSGRECDAFEAKPVRPARAGQRDAPRQPGDGTH
ncbi:MAG: hypothetical protein HOP15_01710 [Planctomycetes bacterium]|nr:hypothetical protein [Planctomycetota bacterium]